MAIFKVSTSIVSRCFLCHQPSKQQLCTCCLNDLHLPLFAAPGHNLLESETIRKCLVEPNYHSLIALCQYEGLVQRLILQLKFQSKPYIAKILASLFAHYLQAHLEYKAGLPDAIMPIPLSTSRYLTRHYNQARLLSKSISKQMCIPHVDGLKKVKNTHQQSSLHKHERLQNMQGAYVALDIPKLTSIAIVDDVITTGSTVYEATKALQAKYPDIMINIWCIAMSVKS